MTNNYDIFISYRIEGGLETARTVKLALENKGYKKIFFNYDSLRDGVFDGQIINAIRGCKVFILVLSDGALDKCANEGDWVATEIRTALASDCKIIPLKVNQGDWLWPDDFPEDLSELKPIQFTTLMTDNYFDESIATLVSRIGPMSSNKKNGPTDNTFINLCLSNINKGILEFTQIYRDYPFSVKIKNLNDFLFEACHCTNSKDELEENLHHFESISDDDFFEEINNTPRKGFRHTFSNPFFVLSINESQVAVVESSEWSSDRGNALTQEFLSHVSDYALTKEKVTQCLSDMVNDPFACPNTISQREKNAEDIYKSTAKQLEKAMKEERKPIFLKPNPKYSCEENKVYYIGLHDMGNRSLNIRVADSKEEMNDMLDNSIMSYITEMELLHDGWEIIFPL